MDLMTTVAVLAVVMAIGVPAMAGLRQQTQATTALSLLTTSLASARITAINRNRPVAVCPSQDGRRCRTDLTWDGGWIIYLDTARKKQPAQVKDVLQHVQAAGGVAIRGTVGRHLVRYLPDGRSSGSNVSLSLCSVTHSNLVGRVVVSNG
ncbi:MAG: GspH/FimT family pseudopilin, partial [Lysobacter sp.]